MLIIRLAIIYYQHIEMRSCALHQNLKVALLLSTWDLMITMLSDNPAFVGKIKGGLKKLWSSLLGLTRSLDGKVSNICFILMICMMLQIHKFTYAG